MNEKRDKNQVISTNNGNEDKTNDENNNIDYKKEINRLKNKVNKLTNTINSFQDDIAISISKLIDEKLSGLKKQELVNERKTSSIADSGLLENIDENDVDMVFGNKSESDEFKTKPKVTQNELPFFDKKSGTGSFLGSAIGGLFAGTGGFTLGMKMGSKFDSKNRNQNVNGITKEFLILNPIQNYNEFVERAKIIDPTTSEETIEYILNILNYDKNDINNLNQFILDLYDKAMERKIESEKEIDYSNYKCKNLLGEYMEKNGKKVAWLSKRTGVPRSTLESICRNPDLMPTVDKALKICRVLGEDLETIFPLQEQ